MAIINCPECGKDISDKATSCPHCGVTINPVPTQPINVNMNNGPSVKCPKCGSSNLQAMILSILVDTLFARISMPKQQYPEIHNISAA